MREPISIWWFAGLLLLSFGVVILIVGVYELGHPLASPPVLNRLHAPIWWGALMSIVGLGYLIRFNPHKKIGRQ
jgi:hypothetical protein